MAHAQNIVAVFRRLPITLDAGGHRGMFNGGGVTCPLLADVLNKFAVPGFEYVAALLPVENKLGHGIFNKLRVDTRALKNLQSIAAWLPFTCDGLRLFLSWLKAGAFLLTTESACIILSVYPLVLYEAEEASIPVITVGALFLPLQYKGIKLREGECTGNTMLLQSLDGFFRRLPLLRHRCRTGRLRFGLRGGRRRHSLLHRRFRAFLTLLRHWRIAKAEDDACCLSKCRAMKLQKPFGSCLLYTSDAADDP